MCVWFKIDYEYDAIMAANRKIKEKPNLSILALISFVASFTVARTFTTIYPDTILVTGNYHIHHFWFGLAMLAIGGWMGISLENENTNRLAAILFGAGGGIISDEIGLLLTLEDYWAGITYIAVSLILIFSAMLILLIRYQKTIMTEFAEFTRTNGSLYVGVFMAAVSVAFILETNNSIIITVSSVSTLVACMIILAYFFQRMRLKS
jgi:hypothetical protein